MKILRIILIFILITSCKSDGLHISFNNILNSKLSKVKEPEDNKNLEAKIVRIIDGDTVEILYNQLTIKLRLEHIDCPEKRGKQPFGNKAKITLSDLCFGKLVNIVSDGKFDRNGRLIGVIFTKEGLNVNKEMVRLGMAWHYKKYSSDKSYDQLEKTARKTKVGLWVDSNPIAPWDFR